MKKVLIGILVIIPIIILLLVTAVSSIVSVAAYIGVDSVELEAKDGNQFLSFDLSNVGNKTIDLNDYLNIEVLPDKATNKVVEWSILDVKYLDQDYEDSYNKYINGESSLKVLPAVMLVDENGNEVESNTSGKIVINAYCIFTIRATAEQHSASISCSIYGYDIKTINVVDKSNNRESEIKISEKLKLYTYVVPLDSIVEDLKWTSSDEEVATVDGNGVVTALKEGTTSIYAYAHKYSSNDLIISTKFELTVTKNISKYGATFYTHESKIKLSDYDIYDAEMISGGVIEGDILTITPSVSSVKLFVDDTIVTIIKCDENDIIIENAAQLNSDSDTVVEVGGIPLELKAVFKSNIKEEVPNVTWTSSNDYIAKVDENGEVRGYSSGLVTITARYLDLEAEIELNVQNKVAFMQLYTSNDYYSKVIGGLAREVVYASERYIDFSVSEEKEANYTYIIVKGAEGIIDLAKLKEFYSAYEFEVIEGKKYAYFDEDEANKLVFTSALEGQGKQQIKVKVSAKYPKYSSLTKYTEEEVTINAIYGVEINNIYELQTSMRYQQVYAFQEGNLIITKGDKKYCSNLDKEVKRSSEKTYAISIMSDCILPIDKTDEFYASHEYCHLIAYGDVYGNNYKLMAYKETQTDRYANMIYVDWSNVTISNLDIRINELESGEQITSGDDTTDLNATAVQINLSSTERILNVKIEYCILENGYHCMQAYSADLTIDGCIFRNVSSSAFYTQSYIYYRDGEYYASYSDCILNNNVFANTLGGPLGVATKSYLINGETGENNFNEDDTINRQMGDEYYNAGYICHIKQTGFMDVYNWQSTEVLNLLQTGDATADTLFRSISQSIILEKVLNDYRYRYKGVDYVNVVGIDFSINASGGSIVTEPYYNVVEFEDSRIKSFSLSDFASSSDPIVATASKLPATLYAYTNDSKLSPSSTYVINEKLIDKLHS